MKLYQVGFERSVEGGIQSGTLAVMASNMEQAIARVLARVPETPPAALKLYPTEVPEGIALMDLVEPQAQA